MPWHYTPDPATSARRHHSSKNLTDGPNATPAA